MIFISNWIHGGSKRPLLIDGESNGEEVGGFGEGPARMGIIFNKDPCGSLRAYGVSSFSPPSSSPFNLHGALHVRDVYISINKTRVQRARLEGMSLLMSITWQFLRGQLTNI